MNWLENLRRSFLDWESMAEVLPNMIAVGLKNTIILAFASTVLGTIIGMILAVLGISHSKWLRIPARIYTDVFRGLPAIVTILLIGQGFARIGRDLFGPSPYPLGILALSLIAGAYIGEIFRSGIQSVERGQMDASRALSMSYGQGMRLVVIPQGVRRVLPALVNQFIGNVKDSSLVYFLGLLASERELFRVGQDAAVVTGNLSPLLLAGIFYLVITVPLTHFVNYIDYRLRTGKRPTVVTSGLKEVSEMEEAGIVSGTAGALASADKHLPATPALARSSAEPVRYQGGSLEVSDLSMAYGALTVLHGINLTIKPGTVTCIIGPSGSGKSTLLRCLNRLVEPSGGDILLDGDSIFKFKPEHLRRRVGMVFQQFNLFPDHTALGNVALALRKVKRMPKEQAYEIAAARLAEVGLAERMHHRPSHLSGGQQQRVAIARALANDAPILVADEPTGNLDSKTAAQVMGLLHELHREGLTLMLVTHDQAIGSSGERRIVMRDGQIVSDERLR